MTTPYARRTPLLRTPLLRSVLGLALGGRPGNRMSRLLAVEASRTTLLRLVRGLPVPEAGTVSGSHRTVFPSASFEYPDLPLIVRGLAGPLVAVRALGRRGVGPPVGVSAASR
ncbi:MAG: hypothetical protein ABW022_12745 [Actinoplanes sp.]